MFRCVFSGDAGEEIAPSFRNRRPQVANKPGRIMWTERQKERPTDSKKKEPRAGPSEISARCACDAHRDEESQMCT
ncbi:hypothetical protein TcasGA2_TC006531 [Tribolium castaneum]|uniref:Uncharacterized protein n=1 Tax=Tribolium castaneum TaxID=7070 RepID=D6WXF0_TRICA|nr:hypothetical protein TcasGA2_TC006531 [Tribolium castaneum]